VRIAAIIQSGRDFVADHYAFMPSVVQDLVCSAYGAQELVRRRGRLSDAARRMDAIDALHWDRQLAEQLVERRLRNILDLARKIPGYSRQELPPSRSSPLEELREWPILTKQAVRVDPASFLTRELRASDIPSLTSGTTGTPLKIWRPRSAFREVFRSSSVFESWFGMPVGGRRASFTGKPVVPLRSRRVWRMNLPGKQLVLSQYHLGPRYLGGYQKALARWRPYMMDGYTSNLIELAKLIRESGTSVRIPLVVTGAELLTPQGRALIEEAFGSRVADKYGSSENVVLAGECPGGMRHIFQNVGRIEVVDDQGHPMPDGEGGRLLLTTFTNDLMPLIRYEVGDMGTLGDASLCSCGRVSPVLQQIQGREDDVVVSKDGRRVAIFAFQLLRGLEGVLAMQLVQREPSSFLVRVNLEQDSDRARLGFESVIRLAFDRLLGPDPDREVAFAYDEPIERAPGGKIRNVVRQFQ
jgi:phenylacetate-CoA ligase